MPEKSCTRLLIVDDDPALLCFLLEELNSDDMVSYGANCASDALIQLRQSSFDLVLLDWTLPDFEGTEICRELRCSGETTPVLMLTAHDDLEDRIQALDLGADDYLTKPFELKELHARIRALLRRAQYASAEKQSNQLKLSDLTIDLLKRTVYRGEELLMLTQREFDLLCYLIEHSGQVLKRQQILEAVWSAPFIGDPNTLDVYMGYLRRKVEEPQQPQLLHTVRGVGFMARFTEIKP